MSQSPPEPRSRFTRPSGPRVVSDTGALLRERGQPPPPRTTSERSGDSRTSSTGSRHRETKHAFVIPEFTATHKANTPPEEGLPSKGKVDLPRSHSPTLSAAVMTPSTANVVEAVTNPHSLNGNETTAFEQEFEERITSSGRVVKDKGKGRATESAPVHHTPQEGGSGNQSITVAVHSFVPQPHSRNQRAGTPPPGPLGAEGIIQRSSEASTTQSSGQAGPVPTFGDNRSPADSTGSNSSFNDPQPVLTSAATKVAASGYYSNSSILSTPPLGAYGAVSPPTPSSPRALVAPDDATTVVNPSAVQVVNPSPTVFQQQPVAKPGQSIRRPHLVGGPNGAPPSATVASIQAAASARAARDNVVVVDDDDDDDGGVVKGGYPRPQGTVPVNLDATGANIALPPAFSSPGHTGKGIARPRVPEVDVPASTHSRITTGDSLDSSVHVAKATRPQGQQQQQQQQGRGEQDELKVSGADIPLPNIYQSTGGAATPKPVVPSLGDLPPPTAVHSAGQGSGGPNTARDNAGDLLLERAHVRINELSTQLKHLQAEKLEMGHLIRAQQQEIESLTQELNYAQANARNNHLGASQEFRNGVHPVQQGRDQQPQQQQHQQQRQHQQQGQQQQQQGGTGQPRGSVSPPIGAELNRQTSKEAMYSSRAQMHVELEIKQMREQMRRESECDYVAPEHGWRQAAEDLLRQREKRLSGLEEEEAVLHEMEAAPHYHPYARQAEQAEEALQNSEETHASLLGAASPQASPKPQQTHPLPPRQGQVQYTDEGSTFRGRDDREYRSFHRGPKEDGSPPSKHPARHPGADGPKGGILAFFGRTESQQEVTRRTRSRGTISENKLQRFRKPSKSLFEDPHKPKFKPWYDHSDDKPSRKDSHAVVMAKGVEVFGIFGKPPRASDNLDAPLYPPDTAENTGSGYTPSGYSAYAASSVHTAAVAPPPPPSSQQQHQQRSGRYQYRYDVLGRDEGGGGGYHEHGSHFDDPVLTSARARRGGPDGQTTYR